tara:strand:- start:1464 stop:3272 length:1809 start_codon:yes stop_codon:yes gene_type:complete
MAYSYFNKMRKEVAIISLVLVVLINLSVVSAIACIDSDGGISPYVKGNISGDSIAGAFVDKCNSGNLVSEKSCNAKNYWAIEYYCPNGCVDGACQGSPTSSCQEGWKCISAYHNYTQNNIGYLLSSCNWQSTDVNNLFDLTDDYYRYYYSGGTLWSPTVWSRIENCAEGCNNNQCNQAGLDDSIRIIHEPYSPRIVLSGDSLDVELTLQNNLNRQVSSVTLNLDDFKGWKKQQTTNFLTYETKDLTLSLPTTSDHTKYNPHQFQLEIEESSSGFSSNIKLLNNKYVILDKNSLTTVKQGESKNIIEEGKTYNVEIVFLDHDEARLKVNQEQFTIEEGEYHKLSDNAYLGLVDLTYYSYVGPDSFVKVALSPISQQVSCLDSDSGIDYYKKGESCFGIDCIEDTCTSSKILNETYCDGTQLKIQTYTCESGKSCINGRCTSSGSVECYDDFDCMMEATGSPYCEGDSVCIDSISYECVNDGTTQSYCDSTPIKDCTPCEEGCKDNQCISGPTPPGPGPSKECDQVGIRQSGKYCSTEYKLIRQKANTIDCENNFECQSNVCSGGSCASKVVPPSPDNIPYWIIGIIVVVALIIIVILVLLKSR